MTSDLLTPDEDDRVGTAPGARRDRDRLPPDGIAGREARIMARIAEDMRVKGRTADEALGNIADAVRYTVQYPAEEYTEGVRADIERLWRKGYTELAVRNCWACDTWKGTSTSWQEPGTGQLFEVQFHTPQSLAARELTYPAYQRLRDPATTDAERGEIAAYLRQVYAGTPAEHAPPDERERAERRQAAKAQSERARAAVFLPAIGDRAAEDVTYYAISDRYCGDDLPAGALRRIVHQGGQRDEAFGRDLRWRHTFLLYSWERGNLDNTLREIGEDSALRITDRIRRSVTWGVQPSPTGPTPDGALRAVSDMPSIWQPNVSCRRHTGHGTFGPAS